MARPLGIPAANRKTAEMIGRRYGMLLVLAEGPVGSGKVAVRCDCGVEKLVAAKYLRDGRTSSCGCYRSVSGVIYNTTHGEGGKKTRTRLYRIWANMLSRCSNPNTTHFDRYGGRGISVCDRWCEAFEAFKEDMGEPPTDKHSIDRFPDPDGNYEPGNCRWATQFEQVHNKGRR